MDVLTKKQRSYTMSRIRGKWTSPEKKIHGMLKGMRVKHKMHPKIAGSPDIIFSQTKPAVFIHGCFWHRCPKHSKAPESRKRFWSEKIRRNVERDRSSIKKLKSDGWKVVVVWEHETKNMRAVAERLATTI